MNNFDSRIDKLERYVFGDEDLAMRIAGERLIEQILAAAERLGMSEQDLDQRAAEIWDGWARCRARWSRPRLN